MGALICIVLISAFGLWYLREGVERLDDTASTNATLNFDDREFGGGNSLVVDKRALYETRSLVPKNGRYRVVAGPLVDGGTELTEPYIDQFARYFLMPRRPDPEAEWILCYGCDRTSLEPAAAVVWDNGAGISILKEPR
jgi:hypothetical protein